MNTGIQIEVTKEQILDLAQKVWSELQMYDDENQLTGQAIAEALAILLVEKLKYYLTDPQAWIWEFHERLELIRLAQSMKRLPTQQLISQ